MNFLQLVQRTKREAGISGGGPNTVIGQTGEMQRLVDWVRDAYIDIQNSQPAWNWLHKTATVVLAPGGQLYHPVTAWDVFPLKYMGDSFWLYATDDGPAFGGHLSEESYSKIRLYDTPQIARPTGFIVLPTREIKFNAITDQEYALTFDYYATAEELDSDEDVPSMPEQYQMAIVWRALQHYADYEEVPYLRQTSTLKYTQVYDQMLRTETPQIRFGGPLA
jgi:hypothetical protein